MKLQWPALNARLDSHTVQTDHGLMAGYLVRAIGGSAELGYLWAAGSSWRWRSPDGAAYGERSSLQAAVTALRQVWDVKHGTFALPFDHAPDTTTPKPPPRRGSWAQPRGRALSLGPEDRPTWAQPRRRAIPLGPGPTQPDLPADQPVASPGREAAPEAPPRASGRIVWNDTAPAFDVTAAVRDRLKKGGRS